jgi:hypothetical protein
MAWLLPLLKDVVKIIAASIAASVIEAGKKTHEARVSRHRNSPHGWRSPHEGNQNSQEESTPDEVSTDSQTTETKSD